MQMKIEKILVPTDFSACAQVAFSQAVVLARLNNAEIHVLHVMDSLEEDPYSLVYQLPDWQDLGRRQQARCADSMVELLTAHDTGGLAVREHLTRASITAPTILETAREQSIDLIVMGTHGRRGFRRFLLGSVAEEVVRSASCPVLTVSETATPLREDWPDHITVPIDFSEHSRIALRTAKALAADNPTQTRTTLDLVHVVEHPVYPNLYNPLADATADYSFPNIAHKVEDGIARFVEETGGPKVACEIKILEGPAAANITQHAEATRADLIVIATHGLTGLKHLLMGSVAEKVLRAASCPVLTLKGANAKAHSVG